MRQWGGGASGRRSKAGANPAAGCSWGPRRCSPGASPWAARARLRWVDYDGDWFPFTEPGQSRSDLTRSLRLFAHNRALTLEGFSPQVSVTQEQRTTNAQLHDYQRIFGELRFVRLF